MPHQHNSEWIEDEIKLAIRKCCELKNFNERIWVYVYKLHQSSKKSNSVAFACHSHQMLKTSDSERLKNRFVGEIHIDVEYIKKAIETGRKWQALLLTVFHEFVHIEQYYENRLSHDGNKRILFGSYFLGKVFRADAKQIKVYNKKKYGVDFDPDYEEYIRYPWEIEANQKALVYFKKVFGEGPHKDVVEEWNRRSQFPV